MNPALHSYTPRVKPLGYDALALNIGCQDLTTGSEVRGFARLAVICVAEHDSASSKLSKQATTGYCLGPAATGTTFPFNTAWAAWCATTGVRVLKGKNPGEITAPANTTGVLSTLFGTGSFTAVSVAFTALGQMALAVQSGTDEITLRRFTDNLGATGSHTITGRSPLLWFTGEGYSDEEGDYREIVLLYLRPEKPRSIFARFEGQAFGTEHEVVYDLPVSLDSLNHAELTREGKLLIYARSDIGRDVTIYSVIYPVRGDDFSNITLAFASGFYYAAVETYEPDPDAASLQCAFLSGYYFAASVSAGAAQTDSHTLAIAFTAGEYS